jgi:hypothetical protein
MHAGTRWQKHWAGKNYRPEQKTDDGEPIILRQGTIFVS